VRRAGVHWAQAEPVQAIERLPFDDQIGVHDDRDGLQPADGAALMSTLLPIYELLGPIQSCIDRQASLDPHPISTSRKTGLEHKVPTGSNSALTRRLENNTIPCFLSSSAPQAC
jgi:hypothetical protein